MKSTSTVRTPTANSTSQQLDDVIAEYNRLVNFIRFTYTTRYSRAHHALHKVSAMIQGLDPGEGAISSLSNICMIAALRVRAKLHQKTMCTARENVRVTRESLAVLKKKVSGLGRVRWTHTDVLLWVDRGIGKADRCGEARSSQLGQCVGSGWMIEERLV